MRLILAFVAILVVFGRSDERAVAGESTASTPLVLKLHKVRDKGSGNMESHTILAPKGWKVSGGAWWAPSALFNIHPSQDISVTSPDGRFVRVGPSVMATDFFPSDLGRRYGAKRPAEGAVDNGVPVVYLPPSLADWRSWLQEKILPAEYPEAKRFRVHSGVVIPELTKLLHRQMEPIRRQLEVDNRRYAEMGSGIRGFSTGSVLAFEWTHEYGGKSYDAMIVLAHTVYGSDTQTGRQIWWSIGPAVTYAAPKGTLEKSLPLLMAISNSVRTTPAWAKMKADHLRKMKQIAAKGAADRAAIWAKSNREINKIINDGVEERSRTMDRTHKRFINTIRGVTDYSAEGSSDSVQLPSQYGHVFTNGNGEYLLSNDALFDPNTDEAYKGSDWKTMKAAR